jgi:hypothetical protein
MPVYRLLTDDALWVERCAAQIDYASARYSEAAYRDRLMDAIGQSPRRCKVRCVS